MSVKRNQHWSHYNMLTLQTRKHSIKGRLHLHQVNFLNKQCTTATLELNGKQSCYKSWFESSCEMPWWNLILKVSRDGVVLIALSSHLRIPRSGHEWVKLVVGSLLCSERFFSGFFRFPLSSKINISKFQFNWMQDLPENHFQVSGASWVNINYCYYDNNNN